VIPNEEPEPRLEEEVILNEPEPQLEEQQEVGPNEEPEPRRTGIPNEEPEPRLEEQQEEEPEPARGTARGYRMRNRNRGSREQQEVGPTEEPEPRSRNSKR
jgi:hypothetical protein